MGNGSPRLRTRFGQPAAAGRRLRASGCFVLLCASTAAAGVGGASSAEPSAAATRAPADICIVLDPLLRLGCPQPQSAPPPAGGQAAPAEPIATPAPAEPSRTQVQQFESAPVRSTSTAPRYDPRRLAVTVVPAASRSAIRRTFNRAGVTVERAIPRIHAYLVGVAPERRVAALAVLDASPVVANAGREVLVSALDTNPDDANWPRQVGLRLVGFPKAWDVTHGSNRVVVAVLDTGVDSRQADLRGALVPGYDFVNADADPIDDEGHGTAVAGVIGARADNQEGLAGICWSCSIMPVKVLDAHGSGDDTLIAAGVVWAADHGARIINMSLGGPETTQGLTDAIAYAVGKGAVVVAAAGNSGTTVPFYPAADPNAIAVAGTTETDQLFTWSNFGPWVGVAAPGCNIAPALAGGYGPFCGTSSATPVVSGLAALVLSVNSNAVPAEVRQAIARPAIPLPGVVQFGRINASQTLAAIHPSSRPAAAARVTAVARGTVGGRVRTRAYKLSIGSGDLSATLRFKGRAALKLSLVRDPGGKSIVRSAGISPLRLQRVVPAGPVRLVVGGGKIRASFVLTVSYVKGRR